MQESYSHKEEVPDSYLERIGKWVSPMMEPLGFDWKMSVCLLTGLPAKEAIVSTMGIMYSADEDAPQGSGSSLAAVLEQQEVFTPAVALAFLIFVLLYFPCVATVATIRREAGRGWAWFTVVHSLLLAWLAAFVVFRVFTMIL